MRDYTIKQIIAVDAKFGLKAYYLADDGAIQSKEVLAMVVEKSDELGDEIHPVMIQDHEWLDYDTHFDTENYLGLATTSVIENSGNSPRLYFRSKIQ